MKSKLLNNRNILLASGICLIATVLFLSQYSQNVQAAFPGLNGKILFLRVDGGNRDFFTIDMDGSNEELLIGGTTLGNPVWSPDGTKLAFDQEVDGFRQLYIANHDGTGVTKLTNDDSNHAQADFSPDGTKLVYRGDSHNPGGNTQIYTMNIDGTNQQRITNHGADDRDPSWSPKGDKIAFVSDRDGNEEVYVMDVDGSNQTNMTNDPGRDFQPVWSPDGIQIVFVSNRFAVNRITTIDADGSNLFNTDIRGITPNWTAEGGQIVFRKQPAVNDIHIMDSDGSNEIQLTNTPDLVDSRPTVQPLTIPPTLLGGSLSLSPDETSATFDPLKEDTDTYGEVDAASVSVTEQPEKGEVVVNDDGSITYTKDPDATASQSSEWWRSFTGAVFAQSSDDSFKYQACSTAHEELCSEATVMVSFTDDLQPLPEVLAATGPLSTLLYGMLGLSAILFSPLALYYLVQLNHKH